MIRENTMRAHVCLHICILRIMIGCVCSPRNQNQKQHFEMSTRKTKSSHTLNKIELECHFGAYLIGLQIIIILTRQVIIQYIYIINMNK